MADAQAAARRAQDSTPFRIAARAGYIVLGVVHIVIGLIAVSIVTGAGGEADQGGAMEQIRRSAFGVLILWVVALGLASLAIWHLTEAVLERDADAKKRWGRRIKDLGTAAAYLAIGGTALVYALGGRSDSSEATQSFSAQLLSAPGGVALLVLVGLAVVGVGAAFAFRGATRAFEENLDFPNEAARAGIVGFGVIGYVAKGIALGVTGILFVVAALTHDPETAGGLDAALHTLAGLPLGPLILWVVGAGLVVYGLFCFARARFARM